MKHALNLVGAGHALPENQIEVTGAVHREWCKRRALFILNGTASSFPFANAYGQLNADLMRHKETVPLMEDLKKITTEEAFRAFVDRL